MKRAHMIRIGTVAALTLALLMALVACTDAGTTETEAPTAAPTQAATETPTTPETDTQPATQPETQPETQPATEPETQPAAAYVFTVLYGDTQKPAEGVQVQLCQGEAFCLMPFGTDAEGKVTYSLSGNPLGVYDVHIMEDSLPEGYTFDNTEVKTSAEQTAYTLTLKPIAAE